MLYRLTEETTELLLVSLADYMEIRQEDSRLMVLTYHWGRNGSALKHYGVIGHLCEPACTPMFHRNLCIFQTKFVISEEGCYD